MAEKAIFLDRDDTIIEDSGYISSADQVKLLPTAAPALVELRKMGYKLIVVTNQSGLARGIFNEQTLSQVHERLKLLLAEHNAYLDRIYYCPYHTEGVIEKYRKDSDWRKPKPGMLIAASKEMKIDLKKSWMIGNDYRDIKAGKSAGCKTILVKSYIKQVVKKPDDPQPDFEAINLREAVNIIKRENASKPVLSPKLVVNEKLYETKPKVEEKKVVLEPLPAKKEEEKIVVTQEVESKIEEPVIKEENSEMAEKPAVVEEQQKVEKEQPEEEPKNVSEPIDQPEEQISETAKLETPAVEPVPEQKEKPVIVETGSRTEYLLEEIKLLIQSRNRSEQYTEFSIVRLLAVVLQISVVFSLVIAIWYRLSPTGMDGQVFTALGFAIVLQLMTLTLFLMQKDR